MPEIRWFGALKVEVEEDTVHIVTQGEVTFAEVVSYFQFVEEVRLRHGRLFVIASLAHANKIPEQRVRALTAQWTLKDKYNSWRTVWPIVSASMNTVEKMASWSPCKTDGGTIREEPARRTGSV